MTSLDVVDKVGKGFGIVSNLLDSVRLNMPVKRTLNTLEYQEVSPNLYRITVDSQHDEMQQLYGILGYLNNKTDAGTFKKRKENRRTRH